MLNGFNFQILMFIKIKNVFTTFNDLCESVGKSKKLINKNNAIKFEQFQKQNHCNQQKNDLSEKSQRFQSSFSDCDCDRDHDCGCDKSSFYQKIMTRISSQIRIRMSYKKLNK